MTRNGAIRWQLHQLYTAELRADHVAGGDQDGSAAPVRVRILCSVSSEASARISRANSGRHQDGGSTAAVRDFMFCFERGFDDAEDQQ